MYTSGKYCIWGLRHIKARVYHAQRREDFLPQESSVALSRRLFHHRSQVTKQDYITRRLLCRDVVVQGNPRVYKALKNQMVAIHEELKRMESISPDNDELLYTLQVIAITLDGLKGEDE